MNKRKKQKDTHISKEQQAEALQGLRAALAPLDERCPLPDTLKGDRVMQNAPSAKDSKAPKSNTAVYLRRGLAFAAMLAVVAGSMFAADKFNFFTRNELRIDPPPVTGNSEDDGEALSTYYELQKTFLAMQKNYDMLEGHLMHGLTMEEAQTMAETMPAADMAPPGEVAGNNYAGEKMAAARDAAGAHGETNTQVKGVDEADILKNDGEYLYYVNQNRLFILKAFPANEMKVMSSLTIPSYRSDTQLYVQGDRMALVYSEYPPGGDPAASIQVYDISDRANPLQVKSFSQKGSMLSSRMQDGRIYLISTQWVNLDFKLNNGVIPEADILPAVYADGEEQLLPAKCIAILPGAEEPSYLVLSSFDLHSEQTQTESAAILGAGGQIYCNAEALYVACQQYGMSTFARSTSLWAGVGDKTVIYRFDLLPDGKIKVGPSGEVAGSPLNQFSMDEYQGHFRIATTGWSEKSNRINMVTVLDKDLKQVGIIDNIAPGESIQSVRFLGPAGYVVTFLQTDPLFALDLADPSKPKITGELKLPGFSAYLHPWDATHLIGVGPDGDDNGTNGHLKISLFDVSNPAAPREADRVIIKDSWTDIQSNHKIFTVCAEKSLFGLPVYDGYYSGSTFYTFSVKGGKLVKSHVLQDGSYANIQRGTYIDDAWYLLDLNNILSVYSMDSGTGLGRLAF